MTKIINVEFGVTNKNIQTAVSTKQETKVREKNIFTLQNVNNCDNYINTGKYCIYKDALLTKNQSINSTLKLYYHVNLIYIANYVRFKLIYIVR